MSLIALLVVLIVFGVFLWWFHTLPIDPQVKWIITAVVIVVLTLFVLNAFGVWEEIKAVRVPKI
jgi:membrane protein YdbS with pleckstrin-like domain